MRRAVLHLLLAAAVLSASLIASGCSPRLREPISAGDARDISCAEDWPEILRQRELVPGIAGSGRVRVLNGDHRGRASFEFIHHRPDYLRLEFRTPLGPTAAVLDIVGDRWLFADFREGVYIGGTAGDGQLQRLTGIPLDPRTLVAVLMAEPRPGARGVGEIRFHPETCVPLGCRLHDGSGTGEWPVTVAFRWPDQAESAAAGELTLPGKVVVYGPEPDRETTVRFKNIRVLSGEELASRPEPVETDGLQPAVLEAAGQDLPRWLQ